MYTGKLEIICAHLLRRPSAVPNIAALNDSWTTRFSTSPKLSGIWVCAIYAIAQALSHKSNKINITTFSPILYLYSLTFSKSFRNEMFQRQFWKSLYYASTQVVKKQASTSTKYFELVHDHLFMCCKNCEMHWRGFYWTWRRPDVVTLLITWR